MFTVVVVDDDDDNQIDSSSTKLTMNLCNSCVLLISFFIASPFVCFVFLLNYLRSRRCKNSIAFFHLYCTSGGGGERVLWAAISALLNEQDWSQSKFDEEPKIYIYAHRSISKDKQEIFKKVHERFKIDLTGSSKADRIEFIPLKFSHLVEANRYPYLTLLLQNLGSIIVACEAAYHLVPQMYIETIGFTFTLPIFKILSCTVLTYVHYPIISSDMIHNVRTSTHASFNNREIFVRSSILRNAKLIYYRILALLYSLAGSQADSVLVNSSWTLRHIKSMWKTRAIVVYPPCDVHSFKSMSNLPNRSKASRSLNIISIAQFRPEKNHLLQIEAFKEFLESTGHDKSRLTLYGGCRDAEDETRVKDLREYIDRSNLTEYVDIVVNAPFKILLDGIRDADVAIHTMKNEHFGIVLVEFMAAGLITLAHNSGGPREDIIQNDGEFGYLADNLDEFTSKLKLISDLSSVERSVMSRKAVGKAEGFATAVFEKVFIKASKDSFFRKRRRT